jgi:hypothetical protein
MRPVLSIECVLSHVPFLKTDRSIKMRSLSVQLGALSSRIAGR